MKESTGGESDQTEDGDCILDPNSDLEAVVYMCTVCSEEFRSSALFLCHSCVDPKFVENNTTNSLSPDILPDTSQNKLSHEMSVDNFVTQHTIQSIEESPCAVSKSFPIGAKNNMALADILREGNVECLVETMEDENNMCSDDTENDIDVVESVEVDTLDEHEEDNFSAITHFRASSSKELTTLKSDCSNKPPKKVRKKKFGDNLLCSGCGDFFRNSFYLATHDCQRKPLRKPLPHGSLGQSPYKCKCGKVIKHKSTFCRHIHHECKLRDEREIELSLKLKQMKNIVFRCKNCETVLKHKFTYLKHIKMCDLPKPYRCEPCDKEYKTVHTLKMHQQIVHKTCPVCKSSFKTRAELIEHKKGEH